MSELTIEQIEDEPSGAGPWVTVLRTAKLSYIHISLPDVTYENLLGFWYDVFSNDFISIKKINTTTGVQFLNVRLVESFIIRRPESFEVINV